MIIKETIPKTVLNRTGGYLNGYSHTLNPYSGCAFGCSYCYVRRLPIALFRRDKWGEWVDIKLSAAEALKKELKKQKQKGRVTIFMSSATDPYQPVEYKTQLTRKLLQVMLEDMPDFLFVQTRSPLVTRDIDLFLKFKHKIRVSVTVETDRDEVRKKITPFAPPIQGRLAAVRKLVQAGVNTQAVVSPILPYSDAFAEQLTNCVSRIGVDDFFSGDGSGGKRTDRLGIRALFQAEGWERWYDREISSQLIAQIKRADPTVQITWSQAAFQPEL